MARPDRSVPSPRRHAGSPLQGAAHTSPLFVIQSLGREIAECALPEARRLARRVSGQDQPTELVSRSPLYIVKNVICLV